MARWRCVLSDRSTEWATPTCTKICVNLEEERRGGKKTGGEETRGEPINYGGVQGESVLF